MKKFYQIIASVALSALAMGATAQVITGHMIPAGRAKLANHYARTAPTHHTNQTARVQSGPMDVFIDYVNGDVVNNLPTATQYYWNPPLYMNMRYALADTVTSPWTSGTANYNTTQYATVVYDTMWDFYTQQYQNPTIDQVNPVTTVDTLWGFFAYHNTSGMDDTVIFEVDAVNSKGFQTGTVYGRDTVIFNASTLPNNVLDSVQFAGFLLNGGAGISIPATARRGWNFAISVKEYGSKLDTFGLWYFSMGSQCSTYYICNYTTACGLPDGRLAAANSYTWGNMWFNDVKNGGNGQPVWFPNIPPSTQAGRCATTGGGYWYSQADGNCPPDTSYYPVQNIALFPSVHFIDVTGVSELTSNGFSVGQNYPNPFNNTTTIPFNLAKESNVVFTVFDMTGRDVYNNTFSTLAAGQHTMVLDATQFKQGVYFYTFNVNGVKVTKRMVITQ